MTNQDRERGPRRWRGPARRIWDLLRHPMIVELVRLIIRLIFDS